MRRTLLLFGGLALCSCENLGIPPIDLERMINQEKYESYEATPYFPDRRVMRTPPEGTVPRERIVGEPLLTRGWAEGEYLKELPMPLTRELLDRGQDRFDIFCAACHGLLGDGISQVAENMTLRKPPSLLTQRIREMPPGRIYYVIAEGYGLMPSYAEELSLEDRWAVVAYLRALQLSQGVPLADLPARLREEARRELP